MVLNMAWDWGLGFTKRTMMDPKTKPQSVYYLASSDEENGDDELNNDTEGRALPLKPVSPDELPRPITSENLQSITIAKTQVRGNSSLRRRHRSTKPGISSTSSSLELQNPRKRSRSRAKAATLPNQAGNLPMNSASKPAFPPLFTWEVWKKGTMTDRILAKVHKSLSKESTAYCRSQERTRDDVTFQHPKASQYAGHFGQNAEEDPKTSSTRQGHDPSNNKKRSARSKRGGKTVAIRKSSSLLDRPSSPTMMRSRHKSSPTIGDSIVQSGLSLTLLAQRFSKRSTGSLPALLSIDSNIRCLETHIDDLCLVSAKFISTFVPSEQIDSSIVTRRIWGSVEKITRQAELSFTLVDPSQSESWTIRHLEVASPKQEPWGTCDKCKNDVPDASLQEALNHLHSHMGQESHERIHEPHEDPCAVRLQAHHPLRDDRWRRHIQPRIKSLISIITGLQQKISEIADRCAKPTGEGLVGGDLPKNLIFAFEAMVALYCLTAEDIARINGNSMGRATDSADLNGTAEEPVEWPEKFKGYEARANDLLEQAQKDVAFLDIADKKPEHVDLETVGREFLLGVMLTNLHDRPLDAADHTDIITPYKRLASRLQYLVHNRPKKRLFIELTTFSRELEALRKLVGSQIKALDRIAEVTEPKSTRGIRGNRLVQYQLECECRDALQAKLCQTEFQVDQLQRKVNDLKSQVVQVLEVLEEDHGKAIRVFTIVTLFFLPMSFVTSFLGMNTTDIRDTNNNSSLFWIIAIPFTAGVVGLAFMYGYKWDYIRELVSRVKVRKQKPREGIQKITAVADSTPECNIRWSMVSQRVTQTLHDFNGAIRRRTTATLRIQSLPK
ncbi:hypothetical protein GGR53DRAFT_424827 [Hypoxylon sp. FL1150]|nr:hypothetical protein GGR53DRAFT_424827 [Hypoxylon sp. FL1150]